MQVILSMTSAEALSLSSHSDAYRGANIPLSKDKS